MPTVRITDGEYWLSTADKGFSVTFKNGIVVAAGPMNVRRFVGQPASNLISWLHSQVGGLRMEKIK